MTAATSTPASAAKEKEIAVAAAHVALEGGLMVEPAGKACCGGAELWAGSLVDERLDQTLVLVEGPVDPRKLVDGHDVGTHVALDLGQALVVGLLESLEGPHEVLEGDTEVRSGRGLHLELLIIQHVSLSPLVKKG